MQQPSQEWLLQQEIPIASGSNSVSNGNKINNSENDPSMSVGVNDIWYPSDGYQTWQPPSVAVRPDPATAMGTGFSHHDQQKIRHISASPDVAASAEYGGGFGVVRGTQKGHENEELAASDIPRRSSAYEAGQSAAQAQASASVPASILINSGAESDPHRGLPTPISDIPPDLVDQQPLTYRSQNSLIPLDPLAPAGTSLRRGMACKFCRKRKLRCSGERPTCTSCIKYKQECEYLPPAKTQPTYPIEAETADLTGEYTPLYPQAQIPEMPSAFSSQPLAYAESSGSGVPDTSLDPYVWLPSDQNSLPSTGFADYAWSSNTAGNAFPPPSVFPQTSYPPNQLVDYSSHSPFPPPFDPNIAHTYPAFPTYSHSSTSSISQSPAARTSSSSQPLSFTSTLGSDPPSSSPSYPQNYDTVYLKTANIDSTSAHLTGVNYPLTNDYRQAPDVFHNPVLGPQPPVTSSVPSTVSGPTRTPARPSIPLAASSTEHSTPTTQNAESVYPSSSAMYSESADLRYTADVDDPVDGLTERLGELLFNPHEGVTFKPESGKEEGVKKRRTSHANNVRTALKGNREDDRRSLVQNRAESDGLKDEHRNLLLDCFLAHCRLFFEMSIPRFRYRMTFTDRRRPSPALLNAMYLWATRMSTAPQISPMEQHFFTAACRHLDSAKLNGDRMVDAVRAAMLLSAYAYTNARHHEGWLIAGLAVRLVMSTGLHQIKSLTYRPAPPNNPLLRNRVHLLGPPEDALELAERVHTFWCVYAIERCGALATGFPSALRDEDITTPFGRPLDEIASQSLTQHDDVTVRDLYRGTAFPPPAGDTAYVRWVKSVTILERSAKLAFLDPEEDSQYYAAWNEYATSLSTGSPSKPPPAWLNQPKYRNPKCYAECRYGLEQYVRSLGVDGISPVERRRAAEAVGLVEPTIAFHTITLHHQIAAIEMLLHDINSVEAENVEALIGARKSITLISDLPELSFHDVDAFLILVWSMIAKVLIKEMHRCTLIGDITGRHVVENEVNLVLKELRRIGLTMHIARTQAKAMEDLVRIALNPNQSHDPSFVGVVSGDQSTFLRN